MLNKTLLTLLTPLAATSLLAQKGEAPKPAPNVVFILADDIGYTDLGCYGAKKIKTPHIDKLANSGIQFTNAYAPASTSSPSRYGLLTGRYAWREGVSILAADAPLSIDTTQITLPKLFQTNGYNTALVGKWHLGLGVKGVPVDFNQRIDAGPEAVGFDYSFYYPATNDRVPCVFVENRQVVNLDANDKISVSYQKPFSNGITGAKHPEKLKLNYHIGHNGSIIDSISRIGWMDGGQAALWKDDEMGDVLFSKVEEYINSSDSDRPFFLYYAPHNAHEPRVPSKKFKGKSKAGIYGDVIEEFDDYIGRLVRTLKQKGIYENTIIILSSDNGPMIKEGYDDGALENLNGHNPYGVLRGEKYSLHEGGTRVPFIYSWPSQVKKGSIQPQSFSYLDMLSTLGGLLNFETSSLISNLDAKDGSQLFNQSKVTQPYRDFIVTQNNGGEIALRRGDWKFIPSVRGSGDQLYNLNDDPSELRNLVFAHLDIVKNFKDYLSELNQH